MRRLLPLLGLVGFIGLFAVVGGGRRPAEDAGVARVGVYDSRAITVAYVPSRFNPLGEKLKEYEQAKADGDEDRMRELEAWGQELQRKFHRQGFAIVPVDDLLEPVADMLPEVARRAGVQAVARHCDYTADDVEVVDITLELVELYDPSPQTMKRVKEIRQVEPVDLDELDAVDE